MKPQPEFTPPPKEIVRPLGGITEDETRKNSSQKMPLWEEYEDYAGQIFSERKGGGGTRKRRPESKTSQAAREQARQDSLEKRRDAAQERIVAVLENFPYFTDASKEDRFFQNYTAWVSRCLENQQVEIKKDDLEFQFFRSGTKAGGQNVNKVNSGARCRHLLTNLRVENEETRDQLKNRQRAIFLLRQKLTEHLRDWEVFLQNPQGSLTQLELSSLGPDLIIELLSTV